MRYVWQSICLGALAFIAVPALWYSNHELDMRISAIFCLAFEVALCFIWVKLSISRMSYAGIKVWLVFVPVFSWFLTILVPAIMLFSGPESDDPGPIDVVLVLCIMSFLSLFISFFFVACVAGAVKNK